MTVQPSNQELANHTAINEVVSVSDMVEQAVAVVSMREAFNLTLSKNKVTTSRVFQVEASSLTSSPFNF